MVAAIRVGLPAAAPKPAPSSQGDAFTDMVDDLPWDAGSQA
jgi:hypothetical protein